METAKLFQEAQDSDIPIMYLSIPENGSMCVQTDRRCYIGMDYGVLEDEARNVSIWPMSLGIVKPGRFITGGRPMMSGRSTSTGQTSGQSRK